VREFTLDEFRTNLDRVGNLVSIYQELRRPGAGRRSVKAADTLRAAVVFMHSALEEVIRNLYLWKLPDAEGSALDEIPLVGLAPNQRVTPFLLGKLAPHRGLFVHNVIRDSITAYVDQMNVNNTNELAGCLRLVGLDPTAYADYYPQLQAMMKRRHQIVHQMDRNHDVGTGRHRAQSISVRQVHAWRNNLHLFVHAAVATVPE
jgi:hypothetical protein